MVAEGKAVVNDASAQPLLVMDAVSQSFAGLRALDHFSITLQGQGIFGLIGPNGAGKTTVFNIVTGLYKPQQGSVRLLGQELLGRASHTISGLGVARTFQNIRLWRDMTVLDNLLMAQHQKLGYGLVASVTRSAAVLRQEEMVRQKSLEILAMLDLASTADKIVRHLSYGEQRKVEIARALTTAPKLLLLDEPAAGLHANETDALITLIRMIAEKFQVTIWMVEHQMRVVMNLCHRIQVIDFGKTIAEGTPQEIQAHAEVIKAYLGSAA